MNFILNGILIAFVLLASSIQQNLPKLNFQTTATKIQAEKTQVVQKYGQLPIVFEANKGQTDERVKYVSHGIGYNLFLTQTETVLALSKPTTNSQSILRVQFIGANHNSNIIGLKDLPGKVNVIKGSDNSKWLSGIPTYSKVEYKGIYKGIDLVYYGNQRQIEYDFVVSPGSTPKNIRLSFNGAKKTVVDKSGDLIVSINNDQVRMKKPIVYQSVEGVKKEIAGKYLLADNNQVSFQIGSYDKREALIIDPILAYSAYLGGSNEDEGWSIAVDNSGSSYITGRTYSTDFPTVNAYQSSHASGSPIDAFVAKLNPAGTALVYSTYLGGAGTEEGMGIAVDVSGSAYITGYTNSHDFPTVNAYQSSLSGNQDVFVTKLNSSGSALIYSTYLGGSLNSSEAPGGKIAIDASGDAYITGVTLATDFPVVNAFQSTKNGGGTNAFVTEFNPSGNGLIFSTYLGGGGEDSNGIVVDGTGNVYVTGATSGNFPIVNALQSTNGGGRDAFVTKFNPSGAGVAFSTYLGGSNDDAGYAVAVDSSSNVYVTGFTTSTNFPTANAYQSSIGGGTYDGFVSKINSAGSALIYSTYIGGNGVDFPSGIAVNSSGEAYITGYTTSTNFPTVNAIQPTYHGSNDVFISKFDSAGNGLLYSTYIGGSSADSGSSIVVDTSGNAYITGSTQSTNFPTVNPFQSTNHGGSDAFVIKIAENQPPSVSSLSNTTLNEGATFAQTGFFTDTDSTSWTATVDYGDGSGSQALTLNPDKSFNLSHQYAKEGTYTVTVAVTDNQGAIGTGTATVTVNDIPALVSTPTIPLNPTVGTSVSTTASFTDPDSSDTHTATINWGDTSSSTGTVTEPSGATPGSVTGSHTYALAGSYIITLSVTDTGETITGTSPQVVLAVIPSTGLTGSNLTGTNYNGANLSGQNLSGSNLKGTSFNDVTLTGANLSGTNIRNASLQGANLTGADLTNANLKGVDLTNANLTNATLTGANLSGAIITGVIWSNTICPNGTNSNSHSNTCVGQGGGL